MGIDGGAGWLFLHPTTATDRTVADNPTLSRYEIRVGSEVAGYSSYRRRGDLIIFLETVIDPRFRGHGLGSRLVAAALADAESRDLRIMPRCSFVQRFLRLQPDPPTAIEA